MRIFALAGLIIGCLSAQCASAAMVTVSFAGDNIVGHFSYDADQKPQGWDSGEDPITYTIYSHISDLYYRDTRYDGDVFTIPSNDYSVELVSHYAWGGAAMVVNAPDFLGQFFFEGEFPFGISPNGSNVTSASAQIAADYYNFYQPSVFVTDGLASSVPEASTWALLLAGFGAIGGAMRRRRAIQPVFCPA